MKKPTPKGGLKVLREDVVGTGCHPLGQRRRDFSAKPEVRTPKPGAP
jgi:hypothetical protein